MISESSSAIVSQLIAEAIGLPKVEPTMSIHNTLEWDSLAHLKILVALESHFDCEFDLDEISEVQSVLDWVEVIDKHRNGEPTDER